MNKAELLTRISDIDPIITKLFRMVRLAENAGFGLDKIESNWLKYNQTQPEFNIDFDSTILRLKVEDTDKDTDKDTDTGRTQTEEWVERWGEKWGEFSENQKAILYALQQDSFITTSHLAEKVGINQRNIKKNLDILKQKQVIIRIGPAKGGRWEIIY